MAINQDILGNVLKKAESWLSDVYDEQTRNDVRKMLQQKIRQGD
jgi:phosphoglucomutase